jgi:CubicO group peptidase (beta-lactamase class C family)
MERSTFISHIRIHAVVLTTCLLACSLPAVGCGQVAESAPAPQYARISHSAYGEAIEAARALVQERIDDYPGVSVAIGVHGEVVWAEGFGWADIEQRVPVRTTSKFRIGSVSKPMTAALLGLVYEAGLIDLDAPVQTYVPSFPEKEYPITTRQLAGHLSGIRHYRGDEFLSAIHYDNVLDGLAIFADDPLEFEPGSRYQYSSYGWNLISAVIEGATGEDFLEQMQSRVFEALDLRNTVPDQNQLIIMDRVRPYELQDGLFYNSPYVDNSYKWAGGGFLSTAEDLVKFGLAHMQPGYLQAETLDLWFTSQTTNDGEETGYGIGWSIGTDGADRRVIGHGGGSVGGTTVLSIYPDQDLVFAAIINLSGAARFPRTEIVDLFVAQE